MLSISGSVPTKLPNAQQGKRGAYLWYVPQQVDPEGGVQGGDEGLDHQRQVQALHRGYEFVKGLGHKINIFF